jgi:hypothetical protein
LDDVNNGGPDAWALPAPFFEGTDELRFARSAGVVFCGPSAVFLPPIELARHGDIEKADGPQEDSKVLEAQEFELSYMPISKGFHTVGGLRVLLLEDRYPEDVPEDKTSREVKILKEWDVVSEIWVST